ncbi:MAG: cardiolipin synthase [Kiritimatiellae bacterium]|nr:cardiolipin synthase [Kiritimatiellia bacterium]
MTFHDKLYVFMTFLTFGFYVLGWLSALHTIMNARTSQGAIAWAISLSTFPFIALPLYWIFGRTRFNGYVDARRSRDQHTNPLIKETLDKLPDALPDTLDRTPDELVFERLAALPYTHLNQLDLLTTGADTFKAVFSAMREAQSYILIQFYIFRDDDIGQSLLREIRAARERGIRVYFLYDEIGCARLPGSYIQAVRDTGSRISGFRTTRGPRNRFQLNFRNHRKSVVVDGRVGFVGGYNVGDEYLGRSPKFGPWRDTHCQILGPAVLAVQLAFVSDWNWANGAFPAELDWTPLPAPDRDEKVLVVPSGPADEFETWKLLMLQCIRQANKRFWLVSPYFVPDSDIISALQLAALRGVEVRIMLPEKPDHLMVWLASFTFLSQINLPNLTFHRYTPGFLHQKVLLVDRDLAVVGTANADNRSFRLNFEMSILSQSPRFVKNVEAMLEEDFKHCRISTAEEYARRSFPFRFAAQVSRLMAPVL